MPPIIPHLWYDKEAKQAAEFYVSLFKDSKIINVSTITGTPSGDCDIVSFELAGQPFMSISAGPYFTFNPSISFHVKCATVPEVDELWKKLSAGGTVMMELGKYPFSERFGWCADRYGLSWQIIHVGDKPFSQKITPFLMFVGLNAGKAEEALNFYGSVFGNAQVNIMMRHGKGDTPEKEGTVKYGSLKIDDQEFGALDSALDHTFAFNEAVSFIVKCQDQKELDYYWEKLSAVPAAEQCGWLKDKYGVSWQIVPVAMDAMMASGDKQKIARVTQAFLKMKKFDIAELERAAEGR